MTELQDLITGLEASMRKLQEDEKVFIRAQGVEAQAEIMRKEAEMLEKDIDLQKGVLSVLQEKKAKAVEPVIKTLTESMNNLMPYGKAYLELSEGGFLIAWLNDAGQLVPYPGLSGGEKVFFDAALAKALGAKILVVEAAEVDGLNMQIMLKGYAKAGLDQVVVSTCHALADVPEGWEVTRCS
jgi:hypothetical protein